MQAYIQKALHGDPDAFLQLYDQYAAQALRLATSITNHPADAADAVQEAFIRVFKKGRQCKGAFEPWFFRIVIHESRRILKKSGRVLPYGADLPPGRHADLAAQQDTAIQIAAAMEQLKEEQRLLLTLRYYMDYSEKDIAAIVNIPQGTVKSRLFYAKQALRQLLETQQEPFIV